MLSKDLWLVVLLYILLQIIVAASIIPESQTISKWMLMFLYINQDFKEFLK